MILKDAVVQTSVWSSNSFLPASLAVSCDHTLEFQRIQCGWKWCMSLQHTFAHETFLHILFLAWGLNEEGRWSLGGLLGTSLISLGPCWLCGAESPALLHILWYGWEVNSYCVQLLKFGVRIDIKRYMLLSRLGTLESSCVFWKK